MTLRRRLVLLAAAAVALGVALAGAVTYVVVRADLRAEVDDALRDLAPRVVPIAGDDAVGFRARVISRARFGLFVPGEAFGGPSGVAQAVSPSGDVVATNASPLLPVDERVKAVARGESGPFYRDETVDGSHIRVLTMPGPGGAALQIARPLGGVDRTLGRLRWIVFGVGLGGIGLAAGLGLLVARAATAPVERLTRTAEDVASTGDLGHRIPERGDQELARLARSFNAMLEALSASRDAQRQLVADASHELRTPLTSARANIELLERAPGLPDAEREAALASVRGQLEELTMLVGDLVDLARPGEQLVDSPEDLRLDLLVRAAVERAQRHAGGRLEIAVDASPCFVHGSRGRIDRAVANLLDNAVKWSPDGGTVEVVVCDGTVSVRDHGPGIAAADLPHVFDRFWRAPEARRMPGSGIGLAIVRQVAEAHGGEVRAERAEGGGARLRLALPTSATS